MCVIAYAHPKKRIPKKILLNCYENNPDGWGIMAAIDNKLQIVKGMGNFDAFWKEFIQMPETVVRGVHFRIKTHGLINLDNCHPFILSPGGEYGLAMMHNGVFHDITIKEKDMSDTWHFAEELKAYIKELHGRGVYPMTDPMFRRLLQALAKGSKVLVVGADGFGETFGDNYWSKDRGIFYSNYHSTQKKYVPVKQQSYKWGGNGGAGGGGYGGNSYDNEFGYWENGTFHKWDDTPRSEESRYSASGHVNGRDVVKVDDKKEEKIVIPQHLLDRTQAKIAADSEKTESEIRAALANLKDVQLQYSDVAPYGHIVDHETGLPIGYNEGEDERATAPTSQTAASEEREEKTVPMGQTLNPATGMIETVLVTPSEAAKIAEVENLADAMAEEAQDEAQEEAEEVEDRAQAAARQITTAKQITTSQPANFPTWDEAHLLRQDEIVDLVQSDPWGAAAFIQELLGCEVLEKSPVDKIN